MDGYMRYIAGIIVMILVGLCGCGRNAMEGELEKTQHILPDDNETMASFLENIGDEYGDFTIEEASPNILEGDRILLQFGEETLQFYLYASNEEAEKDIARISKRGDKYTREKENGETSTMLFSWNATPHFFRKENVIALYVGEEEQYTAMLQEFFGAQAAGE